MDSSVRGLEQLTISIVIVNWNSGGALRQCLQSVAASAGDGFVVRQLIVVDNASSDDSLRRAEGLAFTLIANSRNRGFAAACNQGARHCASDLLLFLNPDVVLQPGSIARAAACFVRPDCDKVAVVGIRMLNGAGGTARSCARFFTAGRMVADILRLDRLFPESALSHRMLEWHHLETREVDHVIGAFYLVRSEVFRAVSGFDECFFMYLEDLDLSRRIAAQGWRCLYLAEASAVHSGCGCSRRVPVRRKLYGVMSRMNYARKHLGHYWLPLVILSALELIAFLAISPLYVLWQRQPSE